MLSNKKLWNWFGMAIGIAFVIAGIIFAKNPPESYSTWNPDYATFGGDFYTYEYDATRTAALNAGTIASNIRELGEFLAKAIGTAMISVGALVIVHYGKENFAKEKTETGETEATSEKAHSEEDKLEGAVWNELKEE
jgi:hypothetical protein